MGIDYNSIITTDGLVGYWDAANPRCYTGTGLTANGLVNVLNGSLVNGVGFTTSYNGTFTFDGSNDYVDIDDFNFNFSNGLTLCAFCYPTAVSNWGRIIDFGLGQDNENLLLGRYSNSNNFFFEVRNNINTQRLTYSANNEFTANKLHYISGVLDGGSPGSGTTGRIYYNGNLISSLYTGSFVVPSTVNRTSNYIARSNWAADAYYQGSIYSVQIYNRALSAAEILQNYNAMKARYR